MFFLPVIAISCGVALLLAVFADGSFLLASRILGGLGIIAKPYQWLFIYSFGWLLAFGMGWLIAKKLHIFPVSLPTTFRGNK